MKNKNKMGIIGILFFVVTFNLCFTNVNVFANETSTSNLKSTNKDPVLPNIIGKTALTMDLKTGEIIYAKDAIRKAYPASITKLMTALIFAENVKPTDIIPVTKDSKAQPPSSLDRNFGPIDIGDTLTGEEVMDALLLFSANDSAYMIADYVSKSSTEFIKLMNKKAKELGMNETHFVTANGLHDDEHYTSAFDLMTLGKAAYSNSWVKSTLAKQKSTVEFSKSKKRILIDTTNKDLGKNGNIGAKTGFTSQAGRCLLSIYERDGRTLLGVVLGSEYGADDTIVFKDMNTIMDYSFKAKKELFKKTGETLNQVTMKYKAFGFFGKENSITVPVLLSEDINYYNNSYNNKLSEIRINIKNQSPWKLSTKPDVKVNFKDSYNNTEYSAKVDISLGKLLTQNTIYYIFTVGGLIVLIILLILGIRKINRLRRRRAVFNRRRPIFK